MPEFRHDIPGETACTSCDLGVPLDQSYCSCGTLAPPRITFNQFFAELERMKIVDGRFGGLIIGRTDGMDDIPMYQHLHSGIFAIVGLMQGGEFLASKACTLKYRNLLEQLNDDKGEEQLAIPLTYSMIASAINTNLMTPGGGIWVSDGQFVINRTSTAKHFRKLELLNADGDPESVAAIVLADEMITNHSDDEQV